jgi:glycine cleavage system H protein
MKYSETHEWIEVKDGEGTVGITSFASKELGEIVYAELPKIGHSVKAKQEVCVLESTKAAADIYSPVSGKILAVNEALKKDSGLVNTSPFEQGWLFKIQLDDPSELESLMDEKAYEEMIH